MKSRIPNAFTLIEMLMVIVIIGLLVGVSIPAMRQISTSSALRNGTRQFSDYIAMTRAYALTNGKDVQILVANTSTTSPALSNTYACIAFAAVVNTAVWPQTAFSSVNYIDKIQFLPMGAIFAGCQSLVNLSENIPFPYSTSTPVSVWAVTINRYGQISPLNQAPAFKLVQGFTSVIGGNIVLTTTGSGTNTITLNTLIGKANITQN